MAAVHIFPEQSADGSLHPAYVVAAGRAAALFAVLAGVGLSLLSRSGRLGGLGQVRVAVAVRAVLSAGLRTGDIWSEGTRKVGTREMGDAVVAAVRTTTTTITKTTS